MIVHVWRRAVAADSARSSSPAPTARSPTSIERAGGRAVMTDPALPTGSDRIHAAITALDPRRTP